MKKLILLFVSICMHISVSAQDLNITELKGFPSGSMVLEVRFSQYRNFFALARVNNVFEIYDKDWNLVYKHQGQGLSRGGPSKIAFSPDEKFIAVTKFRSNNDIAIIRLSDLKLIQVIRGHKFSIFDIQFSNDGNFLVAAYDNEIIIRQISGDTFSLSQNLVICEDDGEVNNVNYSFDDEYLIATDSEGYISIFKKARDQYKLTQKIKERRSRVSGLDYHPFKHRFISAGSSGVKRYELQKNNFAIKDSLVEGFDVRYDFEYSPAGDLVSFTHFTRIKILATNENGLTEVDQIIKNNFWTTGSRFSSDGRLFATFSSDSSLIIWDISPLESSRQYSVYSWLNKKLTASQLKILTHSVANDIYNRVDKSMTTPRDEFETSLEYNTRRDFLEDWCRSILQRKTEESYDIESKGSDQVSIPIQDIIGYNADKQIYKIRFLEAEAGVEIPVAQARKLKSSWTKASIIAKKIKKEGQHSFSYSDYRLSMPGNSESFPITPVYNPLNYEDNRSVTTPDNTQNVSSLVETTKPENDTDIITHALLFGTNVYDSFSELVNPVLDANTIAVELSENYGVKTEVVLNSSLSQTADKLREYASKQYNENENLIVFFAGHGVYDEVFKEGYVISSDSRADDISKTSYLSHSNLRTMINNIGCKRIFLVMDVCFGGTFDPHMATAGHRGSMEMYADISTDEFIKRKTKYKTRLYLTSGGKEYVPDGRSGFHSPFARRFIEALRKYGGEDGVLTTSEILLYVEKVDPQPRFGEFGDNEPGSDFILISK